MKLSVLLTCYNCKNQIDDAIKSVFNQTIPYEWELLIGDDGSNDGTLEIISKWVDKYPNVITLFVMDRLQDSSKSGMRAAKNRVNLLSHCKGQYIAFLDGDDKLLGSEKFISQITLLDSEEYSHCSCSAHNIIANNVNESTYEPMVRSYNGQCVFNPKYYWNNLYFHTNTIVFREKCKELLLDEKYRNYLNDNFITYILIQYGSILYLPITLAQYNITGEGLWTGKKRTYGCFRNIILYDLEIKINPKFKKESYRRHLYDILYLSCNYIKTDPDVTNLLDGLNISDFPTTYLLSNVDHLNIIGQAKKKCFYLKAYFCNAFLKFTMIPQYIIKLIKEK